MVSLSTMLYIEVINFILFFEGVVFLQPKEIPKKTPSPTLSTISVPLPVYDLVIPKSILDTDLYKVSSIYWIESWNSLCSHSFPCNRPFYTISQIFRQHIALQTVIVQLFSPVNASSVFKRLYPVCSNSLYFFCDSS